MNSRDEIVLKKIIQYADEIGATIEHLIDIDILWETAIGDIPSLKEYCERIIGL